MNAPICPVILCGGNGTRLWPVSRGLYPKQFMDLGNGRTLFQDTLGRLRHFEKLETPIIVCNEAHKFYALDGLEKCGITGRLILEPAPRNTAPAIACAAFMARPSDLLLAMPADHRIGDDAAFANAVLSAAPHAAAGKIATFGVMPDTPETGYGYIRRGDNLGESAFAVAEFVEKPNLENARKMLADGSFYWNSGIFLMRADIYLDQLKKFAPQIFDDVQKAWEGRENVNGSIIPGSAFLESPALSIDYAVMEHTEKAVVCPLNAAWGDLGAWESFYQLGEKDSSGNVQSGDVLAHGARGCYLRSSGRLIAALDVRDLAIVETGDAVLVAPRQSLQGVKDVVEELKGAGRPECKLHKRVFRPWGSYESLCSGERFQVKRITVNPGASLSLQMHRHRAEHWVVVSGTAEITNGDNAGIYTDNQSTYIPAGVKHRLRNPGEKPLIIIETQSGGYLGEDDIVRFSDDYGRAPQSARKTAKRDVVILATADWDNPFWTNKQHMAAQFAGHGWRVLYVNSLGLRQPALCGKDLKRMGRRLLKALPAPKKVRPGIWVSSPLAVPFHKSAIVRGFNNKLLYALLRFQLRLLGMEKPLIWTYNPLTGDLCQKLPHSAIVYHCVDDLAAAPGVDAVSIIQGERELGEIADLCFTTSPLLQERMKAIFPQAIYEPNVCDYNHFRQAVARDLPEPAELAAIPRPRALFVGALSDYKVDFDLIEEAARRMPHLHWVIIGQEGEGQPRSRRLSTSPNIHILGPKPYSSLPAFMRHADLAALPARRNAYADAMFPMKFFEYLAGGLQVAATAIPALAQFRELHFSADGADQFCEALKAILAGASKDPCAIDSACRHHSWAERFDRMDQVLERIIPDV